MIAEHPLDLQVLGIGRNGHIGFNEPGTPFDVTTHVVELTESTIEANKRYFDKIEDVPTHALSMGIGSIMQSKKILLMAFGTDKADAIKGMIDGEVTSSYFKYVSGIVYAEIIKLIFSLFGRMNT